MANVTSKEITKEDWEKFKDKLFGASVRTYSICAAVFTGVVFLMAFYLGLMRFSVYSSGLRAFLFFSLLAWMVPYAKIIREKRKERKKKGGIELDIESPIVVLKPKSKREIPFFAAFLAFVLVFVLIVLLNVLAWPIFNASAYRDLISVSTSTAFTQEVQDYNDMQVPVVDKAYARQLGDKHLGEEVGLGSQFKIDNYTLIEHNGKLYWVGALEHEGFFTWLANKDGTPGYMRVNAANPSDVTLVRTHKLKYVPSAFLSQDLNRRLYFANVAKPVASRASFELDENGVPHYVFSAIKKEIMLTNGSCTVGIFTLNAVNGEVKYYDIADIPSWVNHAYPTEEVNEQLNWWGHYVNGFLNSIFAKKEVMQVSEGYNYIYNNGSFYLYTGMTSTGADESIIGVVLVDLRTKANVKLYLTGGLTEYAAQEAARGVFQAYDYYPTFPLLINYHNEPTYLVLLKDYAGFVKQYAFVNLKDLSKYGTGDSIEKAELDYQRNIALSTGHSLENVKVESISSAVKNNNTVYYIIVSKDGEIIEDAVGQPLIFEASINISNKLPFLAVGDTVSFTYTNEFIQTITVEAKGGG